MSENVSRPDAAGTSEPAKETGDVTKESSAIKTRPARVKSATLSSPAQPPARFRKRQIHKTWLPTHLYHAKRAHMTPPKESLWRFALPLTPTMKGYRPTHRASVLRGALAWDMSYVSTIGMQGRERSILGLLTALGVGAKGDSCFSSAKSARRWLNGTRVWEGTLFERNGWPTRAIAPATVIWCVRERGGLVNKKLAGAESDKSKEKRSEKRQAFVRVHPSAFLQLWEEILRLSKVQKPEVRVEDLRFELGSLEIAGPASTEALVGVLWPTESGTKAKMSSDSPESVWRSLGSVANPKCLPSGSLLAFNISDPRLHHPPRNSTHMQAEGSNEPLLSTLSTWPVDDTQPVPWLFDRSARLAACRALLSQKTINRRSSLADPGTYPNPLPTDPKIPTLLYVNRDEGRNMGSWTVLLPWKCVLHVWKSLMEYPISTGGSVRMGCLREKRQVTFEAGVPWFPGDYPGTKAGAAWEAEEAEKRRLEWAKRPKGKRVEWASLDLGKGRKGEFGNGWACDWAALLKQSDMINGTWMFMRAIDC